MGTATSTMKLTSAVIIASTTAQQGARQRENKNPDFGFGGDYGFGDNYDIFSAFNDFNFGSTVAPTVAQGTDAPDYGDYNFGLGDAFGDASDTDAAADYMNTVASDYDGADDLGSIRPSEDDEVKSNFVVDEQGGTEVNLGGSVSGATNEQQNIETFDIQANNGDLSKAQRCFVGSAANSNVNQGLNIFAAGVVHDWFTNGVWDVCEGENDTCEIKVVRRKDVIQQIHSKCANRHSCVDNMRQNFNPEGASPGGYMGNIYHTWTHQACRPRWLSNYPAGQNWNARQMTRDSVCFFCVEPCRNENIWDNTEASASAMQEAECVGRSAEHVWNAAPIPGSTFKLFEDCSDGTNSQNCADNIEDDYGQTTWDANAPKIDGIGPNMKKLNYYSTIDNVMLYNTEAGTRHPISLMQDVSRIQYAQMNARDTNDLFTDAVDPSNTFRFSDNNSDEDNLSHLFDGDASTIYTLTSAAQGADEFVIEVGFVNAVEFTDMTIDKKTAGNYPEAFLGTCLKLYGQDGITELGTSTCTVNAHGTNALDNDQTASITFTPSGGPIEGVRYARLSFDTRDAPDGNGGAVVELSGLSMSYAFG